MVELDMLNQHCWYCRSSLLLFLGNWKTCRLLGRSFDYYYTLICTKCYKMEWLMTNGMNVHNIHWSMTLLKTSVLAERCWKCFNTSETVSDGRKGHKLIYNLIYHAWLMKYEKNSWNVSSVGASGGRDSFIAMFPRPPIHMSLLWTIRRPGDWIEWCHHYKQ